MTQVSQKPTTKLYRKIAVKAGVYTQSFIDPMTGELVSETVYISPEYLRQSAFSTMQMMKRNLDVPVCTDHQDNAIPRKRKPVGQWLKDEMYGAVGLLREVKYNPASESHEYLFEVNDPKIAEKMDNGTIKKVSPNFHNEFSPGDGTRWKNVIGHLALTFRPVDYHQSNAPVEAVRSDGQRRFSVIARQNNHVMIVPMSALRYTDLRGMVRQDAKRGFVFRSLDYTFSFGTMAKFEAWLKTKYRQTIQMSASGKPSLLYFAVMHAPIGGVVINGKRYAGGQFIPTTSIDSLPDEDQKRLKQSIADSDKKRAAYHAKFRNDNETWHEALARHVGEHAKADMTPEDSAAAKRRMNSLRAHHGDSVMHRITALAGSEAKQLESINPDSDKAMHLKRRLRAYHEMGKMLQPGDVPAATGMQSAASKTVSGLRSQASESVRDAGGAIAKPPEVPKQLSEAIQHDSAGAAISDAKKTADAWDKVSKVNPSIPATGVSGAATNAHYTTYSGRLSDKLAEIVRENHGQPIPEGILTPARIKARFDIGVTPEDAAAEIYHDLAKPRLEDKNAALRRSPGEQLKSAVEASKAAVDRNKHASAMADMAEASRDADQAHEAKIASDRKQRIMDALGDNHNDLNDDQKKELESDIAGLKKDDQDAEDAIVAKHADYADDNQREKRNDKIAEDRKAAQDKMLSDNGLMMHNGSMKVDPKNLDKAESFLARLKQAQADGEEALKVGLDPRGNPGQRTVLTKGGIRLSRNDLKKNQREIENYEKQIEYHKARGTGTVDVKDFAEKINARTPEQESDIRNTGEGEKPKSIAEYDEASGYTRKYRIQKGNDGHKIVYDRVDPDSGKVIDTNDYYTAKNEAGARMQLDQHLFDLHRGGHGEAIRINDEDLKDKHESRKRQHAEGVEKAEKEAEDKRQAENAKMQANMKARESLRKEVSETKHKREKHWITDAEGKPVGEVTGTRHGNFLVHRPPFDDEGGKATSGSRKRHNDKGFTLTHIPSGKAAALGLSSQNEGLERAHLLESHGNWSKKDLDQATLEHGGRMSRHHKNGDYHAASEAIREAKTKMTPAEAERDRIKTGIAKSAVTGSGKDAFNAKKDRGAEFGKENPWHAKREGVFAEMRRLHDELTHHEKTNQSLQAPHGTIGIGGADVDSLIKREVAGAYLRELNKGNHPDVAWNAASQAGKDTVKNWNEKTSKGRLHYQGAYENKRWEGAGDSYADDIHRRFTRFGPPGSPEVGPLASRDANGKGDTVVATGRKDYDAANRAAEADDIEARKRGETTHVSEGERGARKFMDQLYRHIDEKDKGAYISTHDLQPLKDWHASLSDDDKEKFFSHLKKSGALTDIKYTKARKAPKGGLHDMLNEAFRTATGNYREHRNNQKKADQYRDKPFSDSEHYKKHVMHGRQMGVVHAPKGGSDAQGHHYAGGQFTPQDASATGADKEAHASAPAQQEKEHFHRRSASHAKTLGLKPQAVDIKGIGKVNNTLVHGQLAIHPNGQGQWRVTHMPTGKRVGQDTHRDAAVHKAYLLHHGLDWNFTGDADAKHAARFQDVSRGIQPRDLKAEHLQAGGALPNQKIDPSAAALNWMKHEPHYLQAKGKYIAKNGTFDANGNLMSIPLNVDDWREHIPGYTGTNAHENHAAASYANERLMSEMLEQMKGKGNGKVVILGGGSGSGKGTSVGRHFDERQYPIRLDQTSSDYDKLVDKIRSLKQHGYQPDIVFVDRPPHQAWQGVVHRAMKSHEKGEPPRTVPPKVAVHSNIEARKVALRMAKENPDIPLRVIDAHAGDPDKSRLLENPQDIIGHLEPQQYDINEELDKAHKHVDELAGKGHVPGHIAKALKQPVDW